MKLSSMVLLSAVSMAAVNAELLKIYFSEKDMANDDTYDNSRVPLLNNVSVECREDLIKDNVFIDCYSPPAGRMNINNANEKCALSVSEKCKKFNENPLAVAPRCANDAVFNAIVPDISLELSQKNINCIIINKEKRCPTSVKTLTGDRLVMDDLKETCKSLTCHERLVDLYERSSNSSKEFHLANMDKETAKIFDFEENNKYFNNMLTFLKSPECTSQIIDDSANVTYITTENVKEFTSSTGNGKSDVKSDVKSDAVMVKATSAMFTLCLILLTYLF